MAAALINRLDLDMKFHTRHQHLALVADHLGIAPHRQVKPIFARINAQNYRYYHPMTLG